MKSKYAYFIVQAENDDARVFENYKDAFGNYQRSKVSVTLYGVFKETGEVTTILSK